MLVQYDPWAGRLMLVAPSIVEVRRGRDLDPDDLRLWVSLHEQTHAVQFNSAPWLLGHVEELIAALSVDDPSPTEMVEGDPRGPWGGLAAGHRRGEASP